MTGFRDYLRFVMGWWGTTVSTASSPGITLRLRCENTQTQRLLSKDTITVRLPVQR